MAVLNLAAVAACGLDRLDNPEGVLVGDLAEDDVLTIQPRGDDGGDEELGAVGVGASVGHGEKSRLGVAVLEVLVGELLTVDGLATSALRSRLLVGCLGERGEVGCTYVALGEVTTLEHELGNHTVELGASIAEALLAGAESAEVLGGLGDILRVELEVDTASLLCGDAPVSQRTTSTPTPRRGSKTRQEKTAHSSQLPAPRAGLRFNLAAIAGGSFANNAIVAWHCAPSWFKRWIDGRKKENVLLGLGSTTLKVCLSRVGPSQERSK